MTDLPNGLKRFLYASIFNLATYSLVLWVTEASAIAFVAGVISYLIAAQDWDWRQRRKAEKAERPEVER